MNAQNQLGWLALTPDDITIGHTFMMIEPNQTLKFLDSWVDDSFRRQGIFRMLWEARWKFVQQNYKGYKVYAWCKPNSLPLLLEKGFEQGETCTYVERIVEEQLPSYERCFVSC